MSVIRTLPRFTESFVFYPIKFVPDLTFHAGYKNMPDIRASYWKRVTYIPVYFMLVMRTPDLRTHRLQEPILLLPCSYSRRPQYIVCRL